MPAEISAQDHMKLCLMVKPGSETQLEETPGIKGTESTLSCLSPAMHSSERNENSFRPQKKLKVNLYAVPAI